MDGDSEQRIAASRRRALGHVRRAIVTLRELIPQNERLRDKPGHEASAEQRVLEAEEELAALQSQEAELLDDLAHRPRLPDERGTA